MSPLFHLLLTWSVLLTVSLTHPTLPPTFHERALTSLSTPLPPSRDPFYTAPENYSSATPGTVLRARAAPGNLTSVIGNCTSAYNILYRTTDSRYNASWAVTTLFVPLPNTTRNASKGRALLSYQIPYDSVDVDASPSYSLYRDAFPDIPSALGRGWYVSVPDYEGPLASFAASVQAGHATLDSVRAVLSSGHLGHSAPDNTRYAMWGYSGGGLASEWAAELQVQYAPELTFSGAALGGLPPNATSVLNAINGELYAGLIPVVLLGATNQYPEAYDYLVSQLNPTGKYNRTTFLSVKNMSAVEGDAFFANQDIWNYFVDGKAVLEAPVLQKVMYSNDYMGYHGVPQMPLFVYKAIADELSPVGDTDALVAKYCAVGANILYQRNTVGGHLAEDYNGDASAFEWLSSVLDGTYSTLYPSQGCTVQNVTLNMTSSPI